MRCCEPTTASVHLKAPGQVRVGARGQERLGGRDRSPVDHQHTQLLLGGRDLAWEHLGDPGRLAGSVYDLDRELAGLAICAVRALDDGGQVARVPLMRAGPDCCPGLLTQSAPRSTATLYSNPIDFHRSPVLSSAQIRAQTGLFDRHAQSSQRGGQGFESFIWTAGAGPWRQRTTLRDPSSCRSAELLQHARGLRGSDLAAHIHVLGDRGVGVSELVGDGTRRQPGTVEEGRRGLAEDVTGDPGKPAPLKAVFQVGLGVGRVT
jgi:hypothetical protein